MKRLLIFIVAVTILISCEKDGSDYGVFTPISVEDVYNDLSPASDYNYYEIRNYYCHDVTSYTVVAALGINTSIGTNDEKNEGIVYTNTDLCMFNNIMSVKDDQVTFWTTYDQILEFLGTIDTEGEALFIAHLNGYEFFYNDEKNGIRKVNGSYQVSASKLVSACTPVETDKFLLQIDSSGKISVLDQQVIERNANACIK